VVAAARRASLDDRPLAFAGLAALGTLSLVWFPLHAAAGAWPWLLFLAWTLRADSAIAPEPAAGRPPSWLPAAVAAAAVVALVWQTGRTVDRIRASRLLAQVESRTMAAIQARRAPSTLFAEHLAWLETARRLDPLEVGVPLARGTQFLLLRRPDEALAAYRDAAALEPRPEIDLNIGRALWMRGDRDGARRAFARAVQLNPLLRREVPPEALAGP
jgi:tetratricopeptide (TPR) repeat protein